MKDLKANEAASERDDLAAAPATLEGWSVLHQMFRLRRPALKALGPERRRGLIEEAVARFAAIERGENGETALFLELGHKADLIVLHFRPSLEDLARAERDVLGLGLAEFLDATTSYLSVVEIGLYEATVELQARLAADGLKPHSRPWQEATEAELKRLGEKFKHRLWPRIPEARYLCFYPMNKRRGEQVNWYRLSMAERQRLMHDHGLIGRRYAGKVTQIISGSVGLDDWEWGVDLFADDPIVFKKLIYEMRFDESSALYAEFGPFHVGIRLAPGEIASTYDSAVTGESGSHGSPSGVSSRAKPS